MLGESFNNTLVHTGLVLLPPVVLSVFCVGMLSVWENVFDVVTSARPARAAQRQSPVAAQDDDRGARHVPPFHDGGVPRRGRSRGHWRPMRCWLAQVRHTHDVGKLRRPLLLFREPDGREHPRHPAARGERGIHHCAPARCGATAAKISDSRGRARHCRRAPWHDARGLFLLQSQTGGGRPGRGRERVPLSGAAPVHARERDRHAGG